MSHAHGEPTNHLDTVSLALAEARSVQDITEIVRTLVASALNAHADLMLFDDVSDLVPDPVGVALSPDGDTGLVCLVALIPDRQGLLEFRFPGRHTLEPNERLLIKALAALCSQALMRVEELAASSRAVERLHRLEQMSGMGLLQMNLEELLAVLPSRVAHALGCETARIFLTNGDGSELYEAGSHGLTELSPTRAFDQGLTGRVVGQKKGKIFADITAEDVVGSLPATVSTVAAVPLLSDERVEGVLDVGASAGRRFAEDDLLLLELAAERIATAIDRSRTFREEQARRFRSEFLADLAQVLNARKAIQATADGVARLTVEWLCERCVMILTLPGRDSPLRVVAERLDTPDGPSVVIDVSDQAEGGSPDWLAGAHHENQPLEGPTMDLGSFQVWRAGERGPFDVNECDLLEEAATRIATTLEFQLVHATQRTMARELQRSLLPVGLPGVDGCEMAVAYWSASETQAVGGDFFDVFPVSPTRWGVLIGDVSGKGVKAAAMTGIARHTARAASRHGHSPSQVLTWVHDAFDSERETSDSYCSAVFGFLDRIGDSFEFDFSVGGHPLPVLARPGRPSEPVGRTGTVLGLIDKVTLHETTVTLAPGDTLLLYTDGVTDVPGDNAMDDEQLFAFIDRLLAGEPSAARIAESMETGLRRRYQDIRKDDTIVLVLQNRGSNETPSEVFYDQSGADSAPLWS
ncbi:hypothetical protein BH23ACT5_BH23ACT5_08350 [soil metagenome]